MFKKTNTLKTHLLQRLIAAFFIFGLLFHGLNVSVQAVSSDRQHAATQLVPLSYQLNAVAPQELAAFYEDRVGLTLLEEEGEYYRLGTPAGTTLLEIFPAEFIKTELTSGLYHTAFLMEDRVLLGSAVAHLLEQKVPLQGFSHHTVSEAAYLADPEGNGIELYSDTSMTTWRYDNEGYIEMSNAPLDITSLLLLREPYDGFTDSTSIGHFHLSVNDIAASEDFYQVLMGFGATTALDEQTAFFASGDYHHYLGTNNWASADAPHPRDGEQGLRAVIWQTAAPNDLDYIVNQLEKRNYPYEQTEEGLSFQDTSGITHIVRLLTE